ncbi:hypothetical protein EV213_109106 [Aureibacillus halotolerans]|uniref:Uncharacterized protein n=1 Tax=Aureibacillus halotolerans TaxID=1508390 RepID=A0A4V3D554_9BACI|nr:hypothetical protein EV213_109106 [Aureibacillus halotolerans]
MHGNDDRSVNILRLHPKGYKVNIDSRVPHRVFFTVGHGFSFLGKQAFRGDLQLALIPLESTYVDYADVCFCVHCLLWLGLV